jgi:ketosteroid isomerase-like protein
MKNLFLISIAVLGLAACNMEGPKHHTRTPAFMDSLRNDLLKTDIAFSKMSEEKGRSVAFESYAADNATILKTYSDPINGKEKLKSLFAAYPDSLYTLTWVPISSDVAKSGEIGFTYGTYQLDLKADGGHESGTYCMVWHKDTTNNWKYILETSNDGLSAKEMKEDAKVDAKMEPKK